MLDIANFLDKMILERLKDDLRGGALWLIHLINIQRRQLRL